MEILTLIGYLFIAAVCASIAELLVPGVIPGGLLTAAVVGVIGAWIGGSLIGPVGPSLIGVSLVPCIFGSAILVFALYLLGTGLRRHNV